jgi:putative hydrolase of the HAD superfamily
MEAGKRRGKTVKYQAVIFDLFGTLVDIFSRREYEDVIEKMAAVLKAPYDEFYKIWIQTANQRGTGSFRNLEENLQSICRELKVPVTSHQIEKAKQERFNYVSKALVPRKDAIMVLSHLKSTGYRTGLISNCSTEPPLIWPETQFAPLIDVAVFSSTAGIQKPDRRIYQLTVAQLKTEPGKCLFIGDGDNNELAGAARAGMNPVLIQADDEDWTTVIRSNAGIDDWPCPRISSLKEVLDLLK